MWTVSGDFIFKKFKQFSTIFAFYIKNRISPPFLSIISSTFPPAKGGKPRTTLFPKAIHGEMKRQIDSVRQLHRNDIEQGHGEVFLPQALSRKYKSAAKELRWQYVFPAKKLSTDPRSGKLRRHHVLESGLQKAVKTAKNRAGVAKNISCHTFRHSFATHLLENGVNIRVVQELMGHADVKTTEIYTHVMTRNIEAIISPLDKLSSVS